MKVLHLPSNIASQMRVSVIALRRMGVRASGITGRDTVQNSDGLRRLSFAEDSSIWSKGCRALQRHGMILPAIAAADVVHWHSNSSLYGAADVLLAKTMGKKIFIEFWGSEVRSPEIEKSDNPYYARVWDSGEYEYKKSESSEGSRRLQELFSRNGARLLMTSPGISQHIISSLFPRFNASTQRVLLEEFEPMIPTVHKQRPLVVHAPTAPVAKGTKYIVSAVKRLQSELNFDFKLLQGMPQCEAQLAISACDIFVDQLILGEYGLAAVEAMAWGKPVICYIKESLLPHYPDGLPIINANPDTFEQVLRELLRDGRRRHEVGAQGRSFVEINHNAISVVEKLAAQYLAN